MKIYDDYNFIVITVPQHLLSENEIDLDPILTVVFTLAAVINSF
jgi:hypothetical protein